MRTWHMEQRVVAWVVSSGGELAAGGNTGNLMAAGGGEHSEPAGKDTSGGIPSGGKPPSGGGKGTSGGGKGTSV